MTHYHLRLGWPYGQTGRGAQARAALSTSKSRGSAIRTFPKCMYVYNYRLFDRYDRPVVSLAVLTNASPTWLPHALRIQPLGLSDEALCFRW